MPKRTYKARFRFNPRHGGEKRGNSEDRRRRKMWLLKTFGNGTTAPCAHCKRKVDYINMTVDRVIPGFKGGTYRRENIVPSCADCNFTIYSKDPYGRHSTGYRAKSNPLWSAKAVAKRMKKLKSYRRRVKR